MVHGIGPIPWWIGFMSETADMIENMYEMDRRRWQDQATVTWSEEEEVNNQSHDGDPAVLGRAPAPRPDVVIQFLVDSILRVGIFTIKLEAIANDWDSVEKFHYFIGEGTARPETGSQVGSVLVCLDAASFHASVLEAESAVVVLDAIAAGPGWGDRIRISIIASSLYFALFPDRLTRQPIRTALSRNLWRRTFWNPPLGSRWPGNLELSPLLLPTPRFQSNKNS